MFFVVTIRDALSENQQDGDERNGYTNSAFDRERARASDGREARLGDVSAGAANSRCAFVLSRMRVCSLIHSFSLVWDLSFFLFESVVVLLPSLRPRVLMTRATTAKDDDDDGVVVVIIASSLFLFRLSLSLSRAHRVGGSEKPSRRPIFEKMRETKAAPKTQRRGSTSASLSHKKRHSHAFALSHHHHRVFSSPSFDRHPENPEQKRRTGDG